MTFVYQKALILALNTKKKLRSRMTNSINTDLRLKSVMLIFAYTYNNYFILAFEKSF